jgi:hypothetical protein
MRVLNIAPVIVPQPVFPNTGITLTKCVLPGRSYHIKVFVPFSDSRAIIVGQDETAFMLRKKVTKFVVFEAIMIDREIPVRIHANESFTISV